MSEVHCGLQVCSSAAPSFPEKRFIQFSENCTVRKPHTGFVNFTPLLPGYICHGERSAFKKIVMCVRAAFHTAAKGGGRHGCPAGTTHIILTICHFQGSFLRILSGERVYLHNYCMDKNNKMLRFTFEQKLYIMYRSAGCGSVWLERTAGGREVAGSNPVTPIYILAGGIRPEVICRRLVPSIYIWICQRRGSR